MTCTAMMIAGAQAEAKALQAEIDRLRSENAAYKTTQTNIMENKAWLIEELYLLRTEKAGLREMLEAALDDTKDYINFCEERDRLRAENAELREALQEFDHYDLDEPILKIVEGLRAILARTAKEGE